MKPQLVIAHEGTLGDADKTRFKFHEESIAYVMRMLTDLYENPELAVIREYTTNARDAHVAAGKADVPIEVQLPSPLEATFVVRDMGLGLSRDEIVTNLTQYGYSSKRETNEAVGMLGIGSKSALTYTSQFSYVACKDGKTVTVLITREDDGAPVLQVISEIDTPDDPNFVEVHVPVKNVGTFNSTAQKFFYYWEPGTVKVNNILYDDKTLFGERHADDLWLSDDVVLLKRDGYYDGKASIIQGNVPYRLTNEQSPEMVRSLYGYQLCAFVDVGTVDFTPSREGLMLTPRTKDCIEELNEFVADRMHQAMMDHLESMTYAEANEWARRRQDLCRWMWGRNTALRWNGRLLSFNHQMEVPSECRPAYSFEATKDHWSKSDRAVSDPYIHFNRPPALIAYGYQDKGSVPGDVKEACRDYITKHDLTGRSVLLLSAPLSEDILELAGNPKQITLGSIHIKKASSRTSAKAIETRYRLVDPHAPNNWVNVHELAYRPDTWIAADRFRSKDSQDRAVELARAGHKVAVVWGRNTKWFEENFPNLPGLKDYARHWVDVELPNLIDQMGPIARHRLHVCSNVSCSLMMSWARNLTDEYLLDPDLKDVIRVANLSARPSLSADLITSSRNIMARLGAPIDLNVRSEYHAKSIEMIDRYPMLRWIGPHAGIYGSDLRELVNVMNMIYAPKPPSVAMTLWDDPSNPNKAIPACNPHTYTHEGVVL